MRFAWSKDRKRQRGSAMLEFAIGASVFVALFTGTFQYGYSFYVYNNLESAVRAGGRYASLHAYPVNIPTTDNSPSSAFVTRVQNVVIYGNPNGNVGGATAAAPGLLPAHVLVSSTFANNTPRTVTVTIHNYQISSLFNAWTLNRRPSSTFTYMGTYQPTI